MSGDFMKRFRNPFGIANYINHPSKGKQPNVFCYSFDFPEDTYAPHALQPLHRIQISAAHVKH
jgi:hypothetical protein